MCLLNGTAPEARKNLATGIERLILLVLTCTMFTLKPPSLHLTEVNPIGEGYPLPQP